MSNELILIRRYFWIYWLCESGTNYKKTRFIREQGRLFQSERAKYAGTFAIDLTIL